MTVRFPPTYQGQDKDTLKWSQVLTNFLNETFGKLAYVVAGSTLNYYLKANGSGERASFGKLALSDTGIDISQVSLSSSGKTTVSLDFEPSLLIFLAADAGVESASIGVDNGTSHSCVAVYRDASNYLKVGISSTLSIYTRNHDESVKMVGYIVSKNSSGYSITATETGTASTTVTCVALP